MRATAVKLIFASTILIITFACAPTSLWAQRSGGHFGGGGFHGGGFRSSGPSSSSRAPGIGSYRPAPAAPSRPGNAYSASRPTGNSYRQGTPYAGGHPPTSSSEHSGSWHFVGPQSAPPAGVNSPEVNLAAIVPRVMTSGVGVRTFVGQGSEVFEEVPRASAAHATALSVPAQTTNATAVQRPSFGAAPAPIVQRPPFIGFGPGFGLGRGYVGNSCWGAPWAWSPFCGDSFSVGGGYGYYGPGDGYYGYAPYDSPAYPPQDGGYGPSDQPGNPPENPAAAPTPEQSGSVDHNWDTSINAPSLGAPGNSPVVIYLKDGTSFTPSDYWFIGGKLHYILGGQENVIDSGLVDLPRSNTENQKNGVKFWLKSAPNAAPAPEQAPPAGTAAPATDATPHESAPVT